MTSKSAKLEKSKAFFLIYFLTPSHEHVKGFLSKYTGLKVDFLEGANKYSLKESVCAHF